MLVEFEDALPDGFNKTLSKEIVIIGQHSNSSSPSKVTAKLDTKVIMTRVIYLLNNDVKLGNIFQFELAPIPTSLFKITLFTK